MTTPPTPSGEIERCIEGVDLAVDAYGEDQSIDEWCKLKSFLRSLQKHSQELEKENRKLREAMDKLIPLVPTFTFGCHGDKCRLGVCNSCNGDEEAEKQAAVVREILSSLPPKV